MIVEPADTTTLEMLVDTMRRMSTRDNPTDALYDFGQWMARTSPADVLITASRRELNPGQYKITRLISQGQLIQGVKNPSLRANPWRDWNSLSTHEGGFLGEIMQNPVPQLHHELNVRNDPVLGNAIEEMGSMIAVPTFTGGEPMNWAFRFRRSPTGWAREDLTDSTLIMNLMGAATQNLLLYEQQRELAQQRLRQFEEIANLQRMLLPARLPDIPGWRMAASYLTSDEAGGDYYDFLELPGGRWGLFIADVSGHGAAAATVMAMVHTILHSAPRNESDPAALLTYINTRLLRASLPATFVTAFLGVLDPASASLTYSRAGHNPPRLKLGGGGDVRALEDFGTVPLGLFDQFDAESGSLPIEREDTLVLYTDGITEAFNPEGEMFGVNRLDDALVGCSGEPDCVIDSIHTALYAHTRSRTRDDDQAIVALRFDGGQGR